jgi:UDP-galactopyranose mutase
MNNNKYDYDYVIVGAGLFGSVFAHQAKQKGKKVIVIDKRSHIGGNCFTEKIEGINVHKYGPHIFHTSDKKVWDFVNSLVPFNNFSYRPKLKFNDKIYSLPINLMSLYQVYGVTSPVEARIKLDQMKIANDNPSNLEEWILSQVGPEIYEIFIKGYTTKQWGRDPKFLPSSIIKRLPIRTNFDDNYYFDNYQGIPIGGYTEIFKKLLDGIEVSLEVDYFSSRDYWNSISQKVVYTGPIDAFYDFEYGKLEYRSLDFQIEILNIPDFQGIAGMNYGDLNVPYTRIIEHKHFEFGNQSNTVITKEYPKSYGEPYYPVNDKINNERFNKYKKLKINDNRFIFGGRLCDYQYYDMHQVIASALIRSNKELI